MPDTPDRLVRRWFEEVWNQGREETIDSLLAPAAKIHGLPTPDNRPLTGPGEFKPFFRRFRTAFPDIRVTVLRTVTEDDLVAVHYQVKGTHQGDALGFASTGRAVEFSGISIARIAADQIAEGWNLVDFLTCYQQVGVLPQL